MSDTLQPPSERPTDPAPPSVPLTPDDVAALVADLSVRVEDVVRTVHLTYDLLAKMADQVVEIHAGFRIMKREHEELRARLVLLDGGLSNGTH